MIKRYTDQRIAGIWALERKYELWQDVELAVIEARERLGRIPAGTHTAMREALLVRNAIDCEYIEAKEKELSHDLLAFVDERMRFLTPELKAYFHQKMTSYDTEESAFV